MFMCKYINPQPRDNFFFFAKADRSDSCANANAPMQTPRPKSLGELL